MSPEGAYNVTISGNTEYFQNVFKTYSSQATNTGAGPGLTALLSNSGQKSITAVTKPSETWLAFDGSGSQSYLKIWGAVYRHPSMSCNFVFFDGHAENIRAVDIAGGTLAMTINTTTIPAVGVAMDFRMLPVQPQ